MIQKSAAILEFVRGERTYQLIVPDHAPYGELFDVAFEILGTAENFTKEAYEKVQKQVEEAKKQAAQTPVEAEVV